MSENLISVILPFAKYLAASFIMLIFYFLFYKGKASFVNCRIYLISIALASILLSQFRIEVLKPDIKIIEVDMPESEDDVVSNDSKNIANTVIADNDMFVSRNHKSVDAKSVVFLVYLLVTLFLFTSLIIQYFRIIILKKKGRLISQDDYDLIINKDVPTPFSFCKTIFINESLSGHKRETILEHEKYHIYHHHYLDVLIMEFFTRLFWFNPVLWWAKRELRNISEFQADRSVLDQGREIYGYQTLILEELMGRNNLLANGFNGSFTKKRFIMMKNKNTERLTSFRRIILLPFFAGVFCMLSFTTAESQVRYVAKQKKYNISQNSKPVKTTVGAMKVMKDTLKLKDFGNLKDKYVNNGNKNVDIAAVNNLKNTTQEVVCDTVRYVPKKQKNDDMIVDTAYYEPNSRSESSENGNFLMLKPDQIQVLDDKLANKLYAYSISITKEVTYLTIAFPISYDTQWLSIGKNFMLVDKKTNDRYMIRWIENFIPFNKKFIHPGCTGKTIGITLAFPPLKSSVKKVDLIEPVPDGGFGKSEIGLSIYNIDVVALSKKKVPKVYE
jgi:hypothetical protein